MIEHSMIEHAIIEHKVGLSTRQVFAIKALDTDYFSEE